MIFLDTAECIFTFPGKNGSTALPLQYMRFAALNGASPLPWAGAGAAALPDVDARPAAERLEEWPTFVPRRRAMADATLQSGDDSTPPRRPRRSVYRCTLHCSLQSFPPVHGLRSMLRFRRGAVRTDLTETQTHGSVMIARLAASRSRAERSR